MRLGWLFLTILLLIHDPALGAEWASFEHPNPPFAIQYPSEWTRLSADKLALLVLVAPGSKGLGVIVVGAPLDPGDTLDDLLADLPRVIPTRFSGYQPLRTDRTSLAGRPAFVHYFTGIRNGVRLYIMMAAVTTDTHGYLVFGMTPADSPRLREELTLLQKILVGFRPGG